jgi:hypothetical protein
MMEHNADSQGTAHQRHIGPIGTTARIVIGSAFVIFGVLGGKFVFAGGRPEIDVQWLALLIGLVAFPAILLALQRARLLRNPSRFDETGPLATMVNILVFAILVATARVPAISYIGFAALIFYGASMLLAALRGYAGCEVLAASNWLLRRDDQIGCLVLSPLDDLERRSA